MARFPIASWIGIGVALAVGVFLITGDNGETERVPTPFSAEARHTD